MSVWGLVVCYRMNADGGRFLGFLKMNYRRLKERENLPEQL